MWRSALGGLRSNALFPPRAIVTALVWRGVVTDTSEWLGSLIQLVLEDLKAGGIKRGEAGARFIRRPPAKWSHPRESNISVIAVSGTKSVPVEHA